MSGFSAEWLALREPADHRARNPEVLQALHETCGSRDQIQVVDLGCGTGSNLRAVAPLLAGRQLWRLVDNDPMLLDTARRCLADWADEATSREQGLRLEKSGQVITVTLVQADLAAGIEEALGPAPDLVTAAALFDLVSPEWIERFTTALAARNAVLYAALTYNGEERWDPPHKADDAILSAFHAHQGRDKGFGPSAGPGAAPLLQDALHARRYRTHMGDSSWHLGSADEALVGELAAGVVAAVRETDLVPETTVAEWFSARKVGATCVVGHTDALALPA